MRRSKNGVQMFNLSVDFQANDEAVANSALAAANYLHPDVVVRVVTDPSVLDQCRLYAEAIYQTLPLALPGVEARPIVDMLCQGTARPNGLTQAVAEKMTTSGRSLESLINGANPSGKTAEVVVTSDYRTLHSGQETGIINPPEHIARNVRDIRLSPDACSRKDLVFAFDTGNGKTVWKFNGQVKTGGAQYVSDTLVEMAKTPGYGKVGYVDARYVNPDGTPRVAPDAFTPGQARRLQEANVRLRGIPDLEDRANQLMTNIEAGMTDGLDPVARQKLQQLRNDITFAYRANGVIGRIGGGAAIAAASAALVSIVIQLATEGRVDAKVVGKSASIGAAFGAGGAAADAALYHAGTKILEMAPEVAKEFARQGVAVGFCVLAIGTDLISEARRALHGDVTVGGAAGGAAAKIALDLLPLVMAPLGLAGMPILVATHMGGRWLIGKARDADLVLEQAIAADFALANSISQRMSLFTQVFKELNADCSVSDTIFYELMGSASPVVPRP